MQKYIYKKPDCFPSQPWQWEPLSETNLTFTEKILFSSAYVQLVRATDTLSFGSIFWGKAEEKETT